MKKALRSAIRAALPYAIIAAYYDLLSLVGIGCPIQFMTGVSCPGCGMSRAYLALLRLDFAGAFHFHPLFPLPPVMITLYFLSKEGKLPLKAWNILVWVFCVSMAAVWLIRLLSGDGEVVYFRPWDCFLLRLLRGEFFPVIAG